jgi:hypothetical protein
MPGTSPFSQEWRDCLAAHYRYTVRSEDIRTERTLTQVMRGVGFTDQQLAEMRLHATMHIDDMPADFVPDFSVLASLLPDAPAEAATDGDAFAIAVPDMPAETFAEPEPEAEEAPSDNPPDPAAPLQLSFF